MLAAKSAIGVRVDALSDWSAEGEGKGDDVDEEERSALGTLSRAKIERHLRGLEGKPLLPRGVAVGPNGKAVSTPGKWEVKEARKYNPDADGLAGDEPAPIALSIPVSEKKPKKDKKEKKAKVEGKKPLIQEVEDEDEDEDEDEEMVDVSASLGLAPPKLNGTKAKPVANNTEDDDGKSDTLSTVSDDTVDPPPSPPVQWQSSILGNRIAAKKARKKERHLRNVALAYSKAAKRAERKAKEARRAAREIRRQKKAEQEARRGKAAVSPAEDPDVKLAAAAGLSLKKYKKKFAKGLIKLNANGSPIVIDKKELKKQKEAEENAAKSTPSKKRKLDDGEEKVEKKKKKKNKD
jgi:nucleolar protein 58